VKWAAIWCGARRTDAWDAIVTLLVTLETEHNHYFHAVMQGMPPPVQLQAGGRRPRRSADGARSSTSTTSRSNGSDGDRGTATRHKGRRARLPRDGAAAARQAIGADRDQPHRHGLLSRRRRRKRKCATPRRRQAFPRGDDDIPTSIDAVIELLAEAGVTAERPRALLAAAAEDPQAKLPFLKRLMAFVLTTTRPRTSRAAAS
jgi:hypothetical protein